MFQDGDLTLCLCDTNGAEDIHINDVLVDEGYAEFVPDGEEEIEKEVTEEQDETQGATGGESAATPPAQDHLSHNKEKVKLFITPCVTDGCNSFDIVCLCVCLLPLSLLNGQTY